MLGANGEESSQPLLQSDENNTYDQSSWKYVLTFILLVYLIAMTPAVIIFSKTSETAEIEVGTLDVLPVTPHAYPASSDGRPELPDGRQVKSNGRGGAQETSDESHERSVKSKGRDEVQETLDGRSVKSNERDAGDEPQETSDRRPEKSNGRSRDQETSDGRPETSDGRPGTSNKQPEGSNGNEGATGGFLQSMGSAMMSGINAMGNAFNNLMGRNPNNIPDTKTTIWERQEMQARKKRGGYQRGYRDQEMQQMARRQDTAIKEEKEYQKQARIRVENSGRAELIEIVEREERKAKMVSLEKQEECQRLKSQGKVDERWEHLKYHLDRIKKNMWGKGEERNTEAPTYIITTRGPETTTTLFGTGTCPPCEKTCARDLCKASLMNPLWRGYRYTTELPKFRKTGCCFGMKGACDLCCPDLTFHPPSSFVPNG